MDTIGERIRSFRTQKGYKQKTLADLLGVKQTSISNWEGNFSPPERKHIEKLAEIFGSTARFIEYGGTAVETHTNIYYIPYLTVKATASFLEKLTPEHYELNEKFPVYFANNEQPKPNQIVIEIEGNSMEPTINHGSRILVESVPIGDIIYINSGIYAVAFDSKFCVKRIRENDLQATGTLTLYSDNQNSGYIRINRSEIRAIWKAIRIVDQKL